MITMLPQFRQLSPHHIEVIEPERDLSRLPVMDPRRIQAELADCPRPYHITTGTTPNRIRITIPANTATSS